MRISDWSSDVCSSDLDDADGEGVVRVGGIGVAEEARLQAPEVVEAPFAPEAHGVAALRRGRAVRRLLRRTRVGRLLVDRHGGSLAQGARPPLHKIAARTIPAAGVVNARGPFTRAAVRRQIRSASGRAGGSQ